MWGEVGGSMVCGVRWEEAWCVGWGGRKQGVWGEVGGSRVCGVRWEEAWCVG